MKARKRIPENLPIRWLLSMGMAITGIAICMWLWMKPQWEQQAGAWTELNHEIKMRMAEDIKPSVTNQVLEKKIHHHKTKSSAQTNFSSSTVSATTEEVNTQRINVNEADTETLLTLPGIGPSKAKSIIEYRKKKGDFSHIEDLMNVKGIGKKIMGKIRNKVRVD